MRATQAFDESVFRSLYCLRIVLQSATVRDSRTKAETVEKLERFLTCDEIKLRVDQIGADISRDFSSQTVVLIGVLKGAAIFLADLARAISLDCTFDFITVSSYGMDHKSSGTVRLVQDISQEIKGKNIVLVEDILDTGVTLWFVKNLLLTRQPSMLKTVTLLDKPSRRLQEFEADYVGFTIPDQFVVGYGMDAGERYRNLPEIYRMTPDGSMPSNESSKLLP